MSVSNSERLDAAQRGVTAIAQLDLEPDLSTAYRIQHELIIGLRVSTTSEQRENQQQRGSE